MRQESRRSYGKYPAKKTYYNGQWFRSNLEAQVAEVLDKLGVSWEYETRCFRGQRYAGGQYTPDFWLPECFTYLEVAGVIDDRHMSNALVFCEEQNVSNPADNGMPTVQIPEGASWPRVVMYPNDEGKLVTGPDPHGYDPPYLSEEMPAYLFVDGNGCVRNPLDMDENLMIVGCGTSGHISFLDECGVSGIWECRVCGKHSGEDIVWEYGPELLGLPQCGRGKLASCSRVL